MFPFNLVGPNFLFVFAAFAVALALAYATFARFVRGSSAVRPKVNELAANPYQVAHLRGGLDEVVKVAVVNLVDRGLLEVHGRRVLRNRSNGSEYVRHAIDKAILDSCGGPRDPGELRKVPAVERACREYESRLRVKGLLLDDEARRLLTMGFVAVLAIVLLVGGARVVQAFSRGHSNVEGLVVVMIVFAVIAYRISRKRISAAGARALDSLKTLVENTYGKAGILRSGGQTNEALLYASVCGIYVLPSDEFAFVRMLYPKPASEAGTSGGDGDGGSCGGGCGGGCGGCGG